jgi:hypothetical protein
MTSGRDPRVHSYARGEFMLGYGPQAGPQLLVLQPFFEEMNRCRGFISTICRTLASCGVGCWLPDLPGTGESLRALETIGWEDWINAVQAGVELIEAETGIAPDTIAFRGGALLDGAARKRWRLSPTSGRPLLSDLRRSALVRGETGTTPAGYRLSTGLARALEIADLEGSARTVRLSSDDRPANLHVEGSPLWRRPEPAGDAELACTLALDIQGWAQA